MSVPLSSQVKLAFGSFHAGGAGLGQGYEAAVAAVAAAARQGVVQPLIALEGTAL